MRLKKWLMCFVAIVVCGMTVTFAGCFGFGDFEEYFTVVGLATEYYVGEDLDLSDVKIRHYTEKNKYTTHNLSESMISWDGTSSAGNYVMEVAYNGESISIDYTVYSASTLAQKVKTNMLKYSAIKMTFIDEDPDMSDYTGFMITTNDTYYTCNESGDGSVDRTWVKNTASGQVRYYCEYSYGEIERAVRSNVTGFPTGVETQADVIQHMMVSGDYTYTLSKTEEGDFVFYFTDVASGFNNDQVVVIKNGLIKDMTRPADGDVSQYDSKIVYEYASYFPIPSIPENVVWDVE